MEERLPVVAQGDNQKSDGEVGIVPKLPHPGKLQRHFRPPASTECAAKLDRQLRVRKNLQHALPMIVVGLPCFADRRTHRTCDLLHDMTPEVSEMNTARN